jgi:DNA transposition AAA+ family ATPase
MALTANRKAELARLTLPSDQEMIRRIRDFMLRAGLSQTEFAQQIGYSVASVGLYINGHYGEHHPREANTLAIRAAAKEFMDLHECDQDIRLRGTHHHTQSFSEIRNAALNALEKGTSYLVDGPPGTEKTWSLRQIEREIRENDLGRVVYLRPHQA